MAQRFVIESGALPMGANVVGFRGSEGLSRPYAFDVYINVPGTEEVVIEEAIGMKAKLSILDGILEVSSWSGVFASFELVRAIKGNALYHARIVARLWELSLSQHSRMFTKSATPTIPDVIKAVLDEEGITDYDLDHLKATPYPEEEHVCQYRESSLDFIHRWCEREGIYYFFEQTDDGEKVVFVDNKSKHEAVKTGAVRYHPSASNDRLAGRHFEHFIARHTHTPSSVKLMDYDYLKPTLEVSGNARVSQTGVGEVALYGGRFFTSNQGSRLATIRSEELRARAIVYHAVGAAHGLYPGFNFALEDHPHLGLNKEYLTTSVEHFGFVSDLAAAWGDLVKHVYDDVYRVDLMAIAADQQYRHPSQTPWPRIDGFENGIVDGAATSEYAQIDDHGRYLVKFKFDEGTLKDGKASTFVRMMQPHGGAVEGFHFPLRKGTEVMFVFMGGDPDRPVIAGVVPNAQKPSPVLAVNHTQNIIQTGGHNFITLEDQSGSQYINIFCPVFETNLYLGIDRPVGGFGVTSGNGPEAAEKGDFKQELGPFNFQLYTKGNGEVYTQGNLNLNATKKLQIEGQAGVYEFAEPEWKRHVKGFLKDRVNGDVSMSHLSKTAHFVGSEAPDSPPHTYVLDVTGDHKIRTTQKSMQHYMTELHEGVGTAPVGGFTHTLKVTGTEKIDISSHREVHVGDNSTIHVGGTTTQTLDGNVTTTHGATTEWNHRAGPTTLNAHGQIVTINCVEHKVNASGKSWHETNGPKSEIVWGLKHETVLGGSVGMIIGLKAEAIVGVKMEATPKAIESEALNTKLTALQSKIVSTSMRVGAASLKALAQGLETYGAMVGPAGFRMH
jgi:type VI secretion system secreted protein VgrG